MSIDEFQIAPDTHLRSAHCCTKGSTATPENRDLNDAGVPAVFATALVFAKSEIAQVASPSASSSEPGRPLGSHQVCPAAASTS